MKSVLELGATIDTVDSGELNDAFATHTQDYFRQLARGIKYLRFGPVAATIASTAVSFDGTGSTPIGPRAGYIWAIRRMTMNGLAGGATPDVVNLYRNQTSGIPIWQFTGAAGGFISKFGKAEMILLPGEALCFANVGALAATGQITLAGDLLEVAAEEVYKLL